VNQEVIDDKELGHIEIRRNVRAKRYSLRIVNGSVIATIPHGGKMRELLAFIDSKRERLRKMLENHQAQPVLNADARLQTYTFELRIILTQRTNIYVSLKNSILNICCPETIDFNEVQIQQKLWSIIAKVMRMEALRTLPSRLEMLADRHGFRYSGVSIRHSKTRWGSCSSKKCINLSVSLMYLPEYLIDYVLLHELCHTREMNHSERFWSLMNQVTGGNAKKLRKELKAFPVFTNSFRTVPLPTE
jgi:predicted metal-dependent hydrolase